jgi:GLPGLI family protein
MKAIYITLIALLLSVTSLFAQNAKIITSGSVEYEKSVNTFAIIKKSYGTNMQGFSAQAFEQYQKSQPQFKVLKSTLTFNGNKTLFTPIITENNGSNFFGELPLAGQRNTVYTDLSTNISTAQKGFFEETFLLKDTVRKIKWKITDETREVAGYTCRRANAIILDSIYVVAFYTTEIHVSGGPESFTGLPGMILELALPHDNVIWRATKVNDISIPAQDLVAPKKGKSVNRKQFMETFDSLIKGADKSKRIDLMKLDYLL